MNDKTQRDEALNTAKSFLIQAPAGSGKTELLTQRYLKLLSISNSPESVLAMTFTKKAVSELKTRVIDALKSAKGGRPNQAHKQITYDLAVQVLARSDIHDWNLIDMPQRLKISTIDGLSNLITARYPQPGMWINRKIITQTWQQDNIYLQAAKQTLLSLDTPEFVRPVSETLLYLDNNVNRFYKLITFMLSKRDQWLGKLYMSGVLDVQSLEDTANTIIKQHLEQLSTQAKEYFNAEFFTALGANTQAEIADIKSLPTNKTADLLQWQILANLCLTGKGECRKTLTKNNGFPAELKAQKKIVLDVLMQISGNSELKTLLNEVNTLPDVDFNEAQIKALANIAQVLKIAVAQLNVLFDEQQSSDFIQVALDADKVLSDYEATDIALFLDYKIQHLLIDEFQDTSSTQFALIEKLIANWQTDEAKTLFLVGDPMQSIYLFRQSQVGLFLQVREFGIANLKPEFLQLSTNFRSDEKIVQANNDYFCKIFPTLENAQVGAISYSASIASPTAGQQGQVKFYPFANKEYAQEAQQVLAIIEDNPDKEIAVLVRNRSHLNAIVPVLKSAKIEFEALKTAPLKNELFTRDLISLVRGLLDLGDKLAWLAILRSPWCGLLLADILKLSETENKIIFELIGTKKILDTLSLDGAKRASNLYKSLLAVIENKSRFSTVQTLEFAIEQLCPRQSLSEEQIMIKQQFLSVIHDCEAQNLLNIKTINQQLDELYAPSIASRIKLMTIHQAKGLEFEIVIIPGLGRSPRANQPGIIQLYEFPNQSLLLAPIKSYQEQGQNATYSYLQKMEAKQGHFESMRLLYVAMTRAKSSIHLLATLSKSKKANSNTFLKLLEPLLQHQFKNTPVASEDTEAIINPPKLERYQTMLNPKRVEGKAYEKVKFNSNLDMGYKSLLGTFTHQCFELGEFEIEQNIINLRLIEMGISTLDLDNASQTILKLLANTKNDTNFNWLFKQRNSTQVEAEFIHQGRNIVIDRLFIEDNILWIIDFKTAELLSGESIDKYIIRQKSKHTKQLSLYKEALINNYSGEIKCALYCPSVQKIIEID